MFGRADLGKGPLVNLTDGGDGASGRACKEETKKKMGDAKRGKTPWKGKKHREESKILIGLSKKGKPSQMKGKKHTAESIQLMKVPKKEAHKEKIRKAKTGVKRPAFSEEWKHNISDGNKGKHSKPLGKQSPEHVAKRMAARKITMEIRKKTKNETTLER